MSLRHPLYIVSYSYGKKTLMSSDPGGGEKRGKIDYIYIYTYICIYIYIYIYLYICSYNTI